MNLELLKEKIQDNWYIFKHRVRNIKYFISYRTTDQYHIFKSSLTPGYYDCDQRLLYLNMDLLKEFYEREVLTEYANWDEDENIRKIKDVIEHIYKWWADYPKRLKEIDNLYIQLDKLINYAPTIQGHDLAVKDVQSYQSLCDELSIKIETLFNEEEEHLIELMKIRKYLWT